MKQTAANVSTVVVVTYLVQILACGAAAQSPSTADVALAPATVILPEAGSVQITLPDGSRDDLSPDPETGAIPDRIVKVKMACDGGDAYACIILGVSYQDGTHGHSADSARAADLFDRACELRDVRGCNNLAVMYEKGDGRPRDLLHALNLYERSCAANHALACRNVGRAYRDGIGTPPSAAKATEAFALAAARSRIMCDQSVAEGCSNLGFMYRSGLEGLPKDEARARQLLQRACDLGYHAVCSQAHNP